MPTFKNISQIDPLTCKILMYGYVGAYEEITALGVVSELDYAAQVYKNANVEINCGGGDVLSDGIAIYNALKNSPLNIKIYVAGIAASLGFVFTQCGRPVYMSKYARLMAHRVTGGVCGNADQMRQTATDAESIENDLIKMISEKSGMTAEEIKTKWFDGTDHWITADEALALGLIDGIYDGTPVDLSLTETDPKVLYNKFNNVLLNKNTMSYKQFNARFGLKNEAAEDEAIEKVAEIEKKANDAEAENKTLKAENEALKAKEAAANAVEAARTEAEINTEVENAVKDGRIAADQKPHYVAVLKSNKESGLAILNSLTKGKRIANQLGGKTNSEGREAWSFEEWSKKDSAGLQNMKNNDWDVYASLFKAQYGTEPRKK